MRNNLFTLAGMFGAALLAQALSSVLPPYYATLFMLAGINAILAASLNVVNGLSGQFSLGHAGFMALGAYVSAAVTTPSVDLCGLAHLEQVSGGPTAAFILSLLLAALACGLAGYLVGLPSLRLRGDYLAIVTLGFGEIIRVLLLNVEAVGGARGLSSIPSYTSAFAVTLVLAFCVVATHRLIRSTHGRALLAVREDEVAAEAMGVDVTAYKVRAFAVSASAAGVAGGLFAHFLCYLNPSSFGFQKSIELVIMVVLGGMGSISGSVLAAILLTLLPEALRPVQQVTGVDLRMVIYSLLLIVIMLARPKGMFGRREIWEFQWGGRMNQEGKAGG
jgi:branched-chain amino acid transport system permease protein